VIKKILGSMTGQLFAVLVGLAIMSACSIGTKASTEPQQSLDKTEWVLASIQGKPVTDDKATPTLSFEGGRLNGFSGCNRLFGSYVASHDGTLALGALGMTKMACMGAAGELERQVLEQLDKTRMYALPPGQLNLMDSNRKTLLVYTPVKR